MWGRNRSGATDISFTFIISFTCKPAYCYYHNMIIEKYSFGRIAVDGTTFTSDIIIFPDGRVEKSWWRKSGHSLTVDDIKGLINAGPEVIIAGTGASGMMKPECGLEDYLDDRGIEFKALQTEEACRLFNELKDQRRTGACLHLTC